MRKRPDYETPFGRELARTRYYNPNRLNALDAGLAFAAVLLAMIVVEELYVAVMRPLIRGGYITDMMFVNLIGLLLPQTVIFLVALFFLKIRRCSFPNGGGFRVKRDSVTGAMSVLLIFGLMYAFSPLADTFVSAVYLTGSGGSGSDPETEGMLIFAILYLIGVAVLPAVAEEMLYRGVIMQGLLEWGKVPAILVSSVMFSFMHGSFNQMLYQFLVGVAIATVVVETRNYAVGSVMHFANNALAGLVGLMDMLPDTLRSPKVYFVYVAFACVLAVVCLIAAGLYFGKLAVARAKGQVKYRPAPFAGAADYAAVSDAAQPDVWRETFWAEETPLSDRGGGALFCQRKKGWRPFNRKSRFCWAAVLAGATVAFALARVILDYVRNIL